MKIGAKGSKTSFKKKVLLESKGREPGKASPENVTLEQTRSTWGHDVHGLGVRGRVSRAVGTGSAQALGPECAALKKAPTGTHS